jgi:uncharacterized protein (TIGR02246 family)
MYRSTPFLVLFLAFVALSRAQNNGWEFFGSSKQGQTSLPSDAQVVYESLLSQFDGWNSHDINRYLELYWKSSQLLFIADTEQLNGWQTVHDALTKGYPNPSLMGFAKPDRIQIRLLAPRLAYCLIWVKFSFPDPKKTVAEVRTVVLQKFDEGWKIIASQGCSAQVP